MNHGTFGIRIIYKDGKKDFQWFIEESLRNTELERYRKSFAVAKASKVSR